MQKFTNLLSAVGSCIQAAANLLKEYNTWKGNNSSSKQTNDVKSEKKS